MSTARQVLARVVAALLLAIVPACAVLDRLDPLRCVQAEDDYELSLTEFRVSQTNQHLDNSIPLLDSRAMGVRVAVAASVGSATIGDMAIEIDLVTVAGARTALVSQEYDCIRPSSIVTLDLESGAIAAGDRLELRVFDGEGVEVVSEQVTPALMSGELFKVVFVPLRVNDVDYDFDSELLAAFARAAHAMFLTHEQADVYPLLDVGNVGTGREASYEALRRLREHVELWRGDGALPEFGVVIGLLPRAPGLSWGVGGGGVGVSLESVEMFLHELGHALGAPHANGCGAPGPLEGSTATVSPSGYDHVAKVWLSGYDYMSYCHPRAWLGAPLYQKTVERFQWAQQRGGTLTVYTLPVGERGPVQPGP